MVVRMLVNSNMRTLALVCERAVVGVHAVRALLVAFQMCGHHMLGAGVVGVALAAWMDGRAHIAGLLLLNAASHWAAQSPARENVER